MKVSTTGGLIVSLPECLLLSPEPVDPDNFGYARKLRKSIGLSELHLPIPWRVGNTIKIDHFIRM